MEKKAKQIHKPSKTEVAVPKTHPRYIEAIGRRKTAVARVRLFSGGGGAQEILINEKPFLKYFFLPRHQKIVRSPFEGTSEKPSLSVRVRGGGTNAQAEAVRLGIARALILEHPDFRTRLKGLGYLKRDPRMVERKKYGSRKARRPQQWRKR